MLQDTGVKRITERHPLASCSLKFRDGPKRKVNHNIPKKPPKPTGRTAAKIFKNIEGKF